MSRVTVTTAGFTVVDANDRMLAYTEHFDSALATMRRIDAAERVRRVSDDAVLATKHRLAGPHFWSALWNERSLA